jgi:hypothetical protein
MSKERYNQIIDDIYKNYLIEDVKVLPNMSKEKMTEMGFRLSKEELINKCITDNKFSEKWGLKIEERELSLKERSFLANSNHYEVSQNIKMNLAIDEDHTLHKHLDDIGIPTKQTTLTYQNESIQFYE